MKKIVVVAFCIIGWQLFANLTTTQLGNQTITSGFVNGEYVRTTSTTLGNQTYTHGTIGDASVRTTSMQLGNQIYTHGNVGDESLRTTSMTLGNQTYTHGTIGDTSVRATSMQLGNQTYTHGNVGDTSFRSSSQNFGNSASTTTTYSEPVRNSSISVYGSGRLRQNSSTGSNGDSAVSSQRMKAANSKILSVSNYDYEQNDSTNDSVLTIDSVFLSRQRITLNDGVEFSFRHNDRNIVRSWRQGDSVIVQKWGRRGKKINYKITNVDRGTFVMALQE